MIDKILEYKDEFVNDSLKSLTEFALDPKNIQRLKDNPKLVKKLTENKLLPSSIRLYIRNIAGVTDKITEDFFSKSELKEIKKRVAEAEAEGSMGISAASGNMRGRNIKGNDNTIGYSGENVLSLSKAFTSPETNIDMTLGKANFSKDDKGNIIITDIHNFDKDPVGGGYDNKEYFSKSKYRKNTKAIPHLDKEEERKNILFEMQDSAGDSENTRKEKSFVRTLYSLPQEDEAISYEQDESTDNLLRRAYKAHDKGDIDSSQLARIIGDLEGTNIPVELGIGSISHEDKLKANSDFAEYIATDTLGSEDYGTRGESYKDVGIPSLIRNYARKFMK